MKKLKMQLRQLPKEVHAELRKVVKKSGREFVTVAKALVPVASGELKETIDVEYKDGGMTAIISAGGNKRDTIIQAKTVEGGRNPASSSGGMKAQPFMDRTAQHLGKRVRGQYRRALAKAAKRVS
ncbi:MAG: HK97 gp10 family phage protein [Rhodobacteraceae bacterium]|nr:HK97 gp10 family phage protein [Paracoccaceae bacterium]